MAEFQPTRDVDLVLRRRIADVVMSLSESEHQFGEIRRGDVLAARALAQAFELAAAAAGWQAAARWGYEEDR